MCNLSMGIYEKGISIGMTKGRQEGRQEGIEIGEIKKAVQVVKSLLEMDITLDKALTVAQIDEETYEKYSADNE